MDKNQALVPWFRRGDIGGITYLVTNNIVNYLIVIATLSGVLKWPDKIVFGAVIPGMSIGLMLGCFYYAFMARRLSQKEGRADVTALPSGVSTPAMFVFLYGVIMPLHYALGDGLVCRSGGLLYRRICGILRRHYRSLVKEENSKSGTSRYGCRYRLYLDGNPGGV